MLMAETPSNALLTSRPCPLTLPPLCSTYTLPLHSLVLAIFSSTLFITDILVNFNLAVSRNGLTIVDRKYIAMQYLR